MRIKVIQYLISNDKDYIKLANLTEKINKKYCEINNYEFKFEYINDDKNLDFELKALHKINYINDNLNNCDYLVFIDADAAVVNPNRKIEDLIDNEHELFLSIGNDRVNSISVLQRLTNNLINLFNNNKDMVINELFNNYVHKLNLYSDLERLSLGSIFLNEGLIIVKNTDSMKEFFSLCVKFEEYFLNRIDRGIQADGAVICFFLQQKKFNPLYTLLGLHAQGSVYGSFENKYDEDKTFILHNFGDIFKPNTKYELINKLLQNKHWKDINFN